MLYFSGRVSEGHADYRQALELDPSNAEAKRLCRQFDPKGTRLPFLGQLIRI